MWRGGDGNNSKCAYRGLMIIQNALIIGGFSFNRNALDGGGGGPTMYQIRGIQNVGVHIKSHFISEINYLYL